MECRLQSWQAFEATRPVELTQAYFPLPFSLHTKLCPGELSAMMEMFGVVQDGSHQPPWLLGICSVAGMNRDFHLIQFQLNFI